MKAGLLAACTALLIIAAPANAQSKAADDSAIAAVVESFRLAIIAKDRAALEKLPASPSITFMSAVDADTLKWVRARRPAAKRLDIGSYAGFVTDITTAKEQVEETFSNIAVRHDGTVADVYFDYTFKEDGKVTNSGHESWGMIRTDDGWKISSIIYSVSVPEPPTPPPSTK